MDNYTYTNEKHRNKIISAYRQYCIKAERLNKHLNCAEFVAFYEL